MPLPHFGWIDSAGGVPTCNHCGFVFRYWLGLKQHINRDICPARSLRNERLAILQSPASDSVNKVIAQDQYLLDWISKHGADELLDHPPRQDLWKQLAHTCCLCTQWCPTGRALSHHLSSKHSKVWSQSCKWAIPRFKARALRVTNPCRWCSKNFAPTTVLHMHHCVVAIQAGILLQIAQRDSLQDDDAASHAEPDASLDPPDEGARCSLTGVGGLRCTATKHGRQRDRQQQATTRRRPASNNTVQAAAATTAEKEASKRQPQERWTRSLAWLRGRFVSEHGSLASSTRRRNKQVAFGCGIQPSHCNISAHPPSSAQDIQEVARRKRCKQAANRTTTEDTSGDVLLSRAASMSQTDWRLGCGLRSFQRLCAEADDLQGLRVLQDTMGHQQSDPQEHRGQSKLGGGGQETRVDGCMADGPWTGTSLSLDQTNGGQLHRQEPLLPSRIELARPSLNRGLPAPSGDVGDHHLGCHASEI